MSEYNNPRPSVTASASDPCTIVDNAVSLDKVINGNSTVTTYTGKQILSLSQAIDKFGFGVAPFTFTTGGILQSKNLLVSNDPVDGFLYKYVGSGSFPLTVTAGTNPTVGSDWQNFSFTSYHEIISNEALRRTYAETGLVLVSGSFESGGMLTNANDVLLHESSGKAYGFKGVLPVTVFAGSAPDSGWFDTSGMIAMMGHNSPETFRAAGDGVADDSLAVNLAISKPESFLHLKSGGKYLAPFIDNPLGRQIVGKGQLLKSTSAGLEMQNSYVDAYQRITGQENLAAWFKSLLQPTRAPIIVLSGDSTTEGVGVSNPYKLDILLKKGLRSRGLQTAYGTDVRNKGHSGETAAQWAATYVNLDIDDDPDLYIVRWGINDVKDVDDFAANLRSGLATYRLAKPFETSSVLLMMPNSTYDIPNNRDAKWYEQLRDVYVQAARDFKCAFFDTYAATQNSKFLANILMDDPYGDGRGIHPNDLLNSIIAGYMLDTIAPVGASVGYGVNNIMLTAGQESHAIPAILLPTQYDGAISFIRTSPSYGWPVDGNAITFKSQDGISIQYVFGYLDADIGKLFIRFGRAALGGQPEGWSEFMQIGVRKSSASIAGIGVFKSGTSRCTKTGSTVVIDCKITATSPSSISIGQSIGTVPAGYRPTRDICYGTATMVNNAGSTFALIPINVQTDGTISCAGVAANVSLVYLSVIYDILP